MKRTYSIIHCHHILHIFDNEERSYPGTKMWFKQLMHIRSKYTAEPSFKFLNLFWRPSLEHLGAHTAQRFRRPRKAINIVTLTLITLNCRFISNFFTLANTITETSSLTPPIVWNIIATDFKGHKGWLSHLLVQRPTHHTLTDFML